MGFFFLSCWESGWGFGFLGFTRKWGRVERAKDLCVCVYVGGGGGEGVRVQNFMPLQN